MTKTVVKFWKNLTNSLSKKAIENANLKELGLKTNSNGEQPISEAKTTEPNKPRYLIKPINQWFYSVERNPNDFVIRFGDYLINSKSYKSHQECCDFISQYDWETFLNVIGIFTQKMIKND